MRMLMYLLSFCMCASLTAAVSQVDVEGFPQSKIFSQALRVSSDTDMIYVSGQLPLSPETKQMVEGDIVVKTNQVIDNLETVLKAAGTDLQHVIRVEIFVTDLANFATINAIYAERFESYRMPVRQTVQVAALPLGSPIEMSCIAYIP